MDVVRRFSFAVFLCFICLFPLADFLYASAWGGSLEREKSVPVSDSTDVSESAPLGIVTADVSQTKSHANNSERALGVCRLVEAKQVDDTQINIMPGMNATEYFRKYDEKKETNFDRAKITVLQHPKHGVLTNSVWDFHSEKYVGRPKDADILDLNTYYYRPDKDYEGVDSAIVLAEYDGIRVTVHYLFHVTIEVNAWYKCEGRDSWKI